jgi:hypothetical protein
MAPDFNEDELRLLTAVPHAVGSAMAFAGPSGLIGTGKEMMASARAMLDGVKRYPDNEVIRAVVPRMNAGGDPKVEMERAMQVRNWAVERMKAKGIDNPEKFRAQALADAKDAAALLDAKATPEQAAQYREWLMGVADGVAQAATEGGFLGFGGERLSEGEKKLLGDLKTALGLA